ncbi:NAD-dependent epimerase/dehydratase family protein [Synechococcus sp. UW179A]|uniref:NAD-dependent epimerase/dehydratase family protein n=1 Tax=Synechococcus sp. UW179A TaxID=2575510 RepID=UPI000E0FD26A|nr:NAD-dependent epimerase/dehydratase family protein [Synechococcus sp. UW179A]
MNIFVSGSNGFIGQKFCPRLASQGFSVTAFSRSEYAWQSDIVPAVHSSLKSFCRVKSLSRYDCVVHLAGRAHVLNEYSSDPLASYRASNVDDTLLLAKHAAFSGVKRFVYLSSIKVNGQSTSRDSPFTELDIPHPVDDYALSKLEAENALFALSAQTGMEIVIIRPPLIYGPKVKGNLNTVLKLLSLRVPLPFGAVTDNLRSFIFLENLIDLIIICIQHPSAANRVFLASDQDDVSTFDFLNLVGLSCNYSAFLFPVPRRFLKYMCILFGKYYLFDRLCNSLVVDSSLATTLLGWNPRFSLRLGLQKSLSDL